MKLGVFFTATVAAEGCAPADWQDSSYPPDNCANWSSNGWCTAGGELGSTWVASWGDFSDYANNGFDPSHCAECGCVEPPGNTCIPTTSTSGYNYIKVISGEANLKSVWFSVEASNDVHISLSSEDPVSTSSWELVLGGWAGTKSVVRSSHQGANLLSVSHTPEQFNTWTKNFELRMTEHSLGLFDESGNTIIKYDEFDSTDIGFLYVATGWGSTGEWVIRCQSPDDLSVVPWGFTRLEKLNSWGAQCVPNLVRSGASQRGVKNINRKLGRLHRYAAKFYNENKDMNNPFAPEERGINLDDACACVSHVGQGYWKFFARAYDSNVRNRASEAKALVKKLRNRLDKSYGCSVA